MPLSISCSFCQRRPEKARNLFAGPTAQVCDSCIRDMTQLVETGSSPAGRVPFPTPGDQGGSLPGLSTSHHLRCSYCGKSESAVPAMFVGATTNICLECYECCREVLRERALKD
jgi:ATP-dependent protease Clp ATPase subunit